ncbi:DUF4148 domain-containing protein [Burkholderia alba]|uniref:DUF4148 domain-containing protein n=1 Tax=Burkholderia alba TaxID=2683677 RepID=UPI002B05267B|nr:DUF4148 domain-containing protein [Burkholderia alba]
MKLTPRVLACTFLMVLGTTAHAAPKLTPQQCTDYPFVHTKGPITHAQLINELSELESVGYNPAAGEDDNYPDDIDGAQQRLMTKYQQDCRGAGSSVAANTP